jgi:hypothetical protein
VALPCAARIRYLFEIEFGGISFTVHDSAWRTLGSLARASNKLGVTVEFLSPDGFPSFQLPTYPGCRF